MQPLVRAASCCRASAASRQSVCEKCEGCSGEFKLPQFFLGQKKTPKLHCCKESCLPLLQAKHSELKKAHLGSYTTAAGTSKPFSNYYFIYQQFRFTTEV